MLTIKTEEMSKEINDFFTSNSDNENLSDGIIMSARDGDKLLAVGALTMENYLVHLNHIAPIENTPENTSLILGLMKSLLNLADLRGIKTVYGSNSKMDKLYKLLKFNKIKGGEFELSLEGYFTCEH